MSTDLNAQILCEKLTASAKLPEYAHTGDAGADLFSNCDYVLEPGQSALIGTGLMISLPSGYEAQIRPKSGIAVNYAVTVLNTPGTIDSGYRGEVGVILINHGKRQFPIKKGMKIAQMVISKYEHARFQQGFVDDDTTRGCGGFGSTGL